MVIYAVFFFNDTATTEIYTLSLHDALPICFPLPAPRFHSPCAGIRNARLNRLDAFSHAMIAVSATISSSEKWRRRVSKRASRSEEHTSELQSRQYLVCRLLLEKKKSLSYLT